VQPVAEEENCTRQLQFNAHCIAICSIRFCTHAVTFISHAFLCAAFQLLPGLKRSPGSITPLPSPCRQPPFFISASAAAAGAGAAVDQGAMEQTLKAPM
jgi:hypothetical protein